MKINQLFVTVITIERLNEMAGYFGLTDVDDTRSFNKFTIRQRGTMDKFDQNADWIRGLYLPCKAKLYVIVPMSERRCVNVFRQCLRLHGYGLHVQEKNLVPNVSKYISYSVHRHGASALQFCNTPRLINMS